MIDREVCSMPEVFIYGDSDPSDEIFNRPSDGDSSSFFKAYKERNLTGDTFNKFTGRINDSKFAEVVDALFD